MRQEGGSPAEGEIHLFILWSSALAHADAIYADLEQQFELVDSFLVTWGPDRFRENMLRLYGFAIPERIDKTTGTGTDPFHVVVVRDVAPRYETRWRSWGLGPANARTYDAKLRYRRWTGGGFRVHATIDRREAARDLFMLLGRRVDGYGGAAAAPWTSQPLHIWTSDVVGAEGWTSEQELLSAFEVCLNYVLLWHERTDDAERLTLLVDDARRAGLVASGVSDLPHPPELECSIAGRHVPLSLREVGDGTLDPIWQRAILRHPARRADGVFVPPEEDRPYISLYELVAHTPADNERRSRLAQLVRESDSSPGNYENPLYAKAVLEEFMLRQGYTYGVPRDRTLSRNPDVLGRVPRLRRVLRRRAPRLSRLGGRMLQKASSIRERASL
jgi:hypothetical protein